MMQVPVDQTINQIPVRTTNIDLLRYVQDRAGIVDRLRPRREARGTNRTLANGTERTDFVDPDFLYEESRY